MSDTPEVERPQRRRHCEHGAYLGSCTVEDCPDRARHVCRTVPCDVVGCEHSPAPTMCSKCGANVASGAIDAQGRRYCIDCAPPSATVHPVRVGESPRVLAGTVRGTGYEPGKDSEGASWEWLPYDVAAVDASGKPLRDGFDRQLYEKHDSPVHVKNARPGKAGRSRTNTVSESRADLERIVEAAQLPDRERQVWIRKQAGRSHAEIAEELDLTPDQVRYAITNINKALTATVRRDGWEMGT